MLTWLELKILCIQYLLLGLAMNIIETERLVISVPSFDDAEGMVNLLNQDSFISNIADRGVRNEEDAISTFDAVCQNLKIAVNYKVTLPAKKPLHK